MSGAFDFLSLDFFSWFHLACWSREIKPSYIHKMAAAAAAPVIAMVFNGITFALFLRLPKMTGKPKRGQAIAADRLERDWLYIYTIKYTNMVFY